VPRMRHPLAEANQRTVVFGESARRGDLADRGGAQVGEDLRREDGRVGAFPGPGAGGELVG
jgi:hypothetical protein